LIAANVVISLFSLAVVNVGISVIGCKWTVQVCLTELSPWTGFAYVGVMFIVGTLFLKFGEFPFSNVTLWSFIRRHFDKGLSEPEETQRLIQTNSAHKDTATELLKCRVRAYKPSPTPNGETAGILEVIVEGIVATARLARQKKETDTKFAYLLYQRWSRTHLTSAQRSNFEGSGRGRRDYWE
jgi:hypothetical protein